MSSSGKPAQRRIRYGALATAILTLMLTCVIVAFLAHSPLQTATTVVAEPTATVMPGATPAVGSTVICPNGYVCTPADANTGGFLGLTSSQVNGIGFASAILSLAGFLFSSGRFLLGLRHPTAS
jgi:hypothetical protein